jgi:KaiC/GvpD/RAD55 family RecA-like ATPase
MSADAAIELHDAHVRAFEAYAEDAQRKAAKDAVEAWEARAEREAIQAESVAYEQQVAFSWGRDERDAYPKQIAVDDFAAFAHYVCKHRAKRKGLGYFAAAFADNGDGKHHRCLPDALPRRFLPLDLDYIEDGETLSALLLALQPWRHFAYTTASHTANKPRARVVLELARPVDRTEGMRIGLAFQRDLLAAAGLANGAVKFDESVYRAEQPCFGLVTGSEIYPRDRRMNGKPLDVDALLATAPEIAPTVTAKDRADNIAGDDPLVRHLAAHGYLLDAPAPLGKLAIRCPNETAHSETTSPTSTVVLLPHFNGVSRAVVKCLHDSCANITQEEFKRLVGYTDPSPAATNNAEPEKSELEFAFADELGDTGDEADELIEHMLTRGAMGVIYGDSNSGKTFLAIDVACAIARHVLWMGRHVEPGMVVYLATESPSSVRRRLRAYQRHYGAKVPNFVIVKSPIDLFNSADDTGRIIALVRQLEQRVGVKCQIVVGDTLSRLSAGANENSGEDMSIVVHHVDRIRHECSVHFLLIHHTGKDAARGMRGWSGMRAATDTEIEVTTDDQTGTHAAEITKQRDIPGKGERIGFRLQVVEMGLGKWGKPITSCVVVSADAPVKPGKRPSEIAGAITEVLSSRGTGMRRRELVEHFEARYHRGSVYKEIQKMKEAKRLIEVVGVIALAS